ncbi:rhodanese-like domain-containing protein [Pseudomonas sp. PDM15]|uniref:rhodanese-like domain-containing protein n=1 Tax=Pseudomonas sp. PDM15 TaxID=2769303 RepID=UPI0017818418|nr:rhodanese-like domain-containing protein [Pseudomonas sp. PDM15]MBD9427862.1 rhodanese-like domain-containing protein [Pseudomonas sp. PDM15]
MPQHDEEFLRRAAEAKGRIVQLAPAEARQRIEAGSLLLDVRSDEEYAEGHIEGARHVPGEELARRVAELQPDRQAPILCYCRGGNRGALAADELQRLGYSNVASIEGGLTAFLAEPD